MAADLLVEDEVLDIGRDLGRDAREHGLRAGDEGLVGGDLPGHGGAEDSGIRCVAPVPARMRMAMESRLACLLLAFLVAACGGESPAVSHPAEPGERHLKNVRQLTF